MCTSLTGQSPNDAKYEVYFPDWFNRRVARSICNILNMKMGSFPIVYLGVAISSSRLSRALFNHMLVKSELKLNFWRNLNLSGMGEATLINSIIMIFPQYYMASYPIPDTILNSIEQLARKLFWSQEGDIKGVHLISWNKDTLPKTEGGSWYSQSEVS